MNSGNTTSTFSQDYFVLRGKWINLTKNTSQSNNTAVRLFMQEISAAKSKKSISPKEYEMLLGLVRDGEKVNQSSEYIRIRDVYNALRDVNGKLSGRNQNDLVEEINLAYDSSLISDSEKEDLMKRVDGEYNEKQKVVDIQEGYRSKETPMRKRAAERKNKHSTGYDDMLSEYKSLYTDRNSNKEYAVQKFFQDLEDAYRTKKITLKEFKEFHAALDSQEVFLIEVEVDRSSPDFIRFRESLVDLVSDDEEVYQVMKQVALWARNRGASIQSIKNNMPLIANTHLEDFFKSGQMMVTVLSRARGGGNIIEMKLS